VGDREDIFIPGLGTDAAAGMKQGLTKERAWRSATNGRGPWRNAGASHMHAAFPKSRFDHLGLVSLLDAVQRLQRVSGTAVCGIACTVVWEGDRCKPGPYPIADSLAWSSVSLSEARAAFVGTLTAGAIGE